MRVLLDADVERLATPEVVAASMRRALVAAYRGGLVAPPRVLAPMGRFHLSFSCGRVPGDWYGHRSYVAPGSGDEQQLSVVQDERTGAVRGVAVGGALGPRRTGGTTAVVLEALAPDDTGRLLLVGAGTQAWHQLWALPERFRQLPIRVASRTQTTRDALVDRARRELGLDARAADDPAAAARDADVVILATSSATPVLRGSDLRPGALVATLGPKQVGNAEFGPDLVAGAALVVSDSPAQVAAYDPPNVLAGAVDDTLGHLGAVLAGDRTVPDGSRAFLGVGLAGADAWLLNDLLTAPGVRP